MLPKQELLRITECILQRSIETRSQYLQKVAELEHNKLALAHIEPSNAAHVLAAVTDQQRIIMRQNDRLNIGIVSSYNELVSAHTPYEKYPAIIKQEALAQGHSATFIGGVPAICDGVVQGYQGMELSLMSRDIIAMATAIPITCSSSDRIILLGTCDKIVPGMLIGALSRGYLPAVFIPSGPMASGITNHEKSTARQEFHQGKISVEGLLDTECKCYHSAGTCTFYGTANTNQVMLEALGLQPIDSGLAPLNDEKWSHVNAITSELLKNHLPKLSDIINEKSIVNACVTWLATGGSTNHTLHLVAIARAAGILLTWEDIDALSNIVPTIAKIYPNGPCDVNDFHRSGGVSAIMNTLLSNGLIHAEAIDYSGQRIDEAINSAFHGISDPRIIASFDEPFDKKAGIKLLQGNLGQGIMKVSAVDPKRRKVVAKARVFETQHAVYEAYQAGELFDDVIVVVKNQGAVANGMPELHKLIPLLGNIYDKGFSVALVTDGRLSGASGKVPAVVHLTPEARKSGPINNISDGDIIEVDGNLGRINLIGEDISPLNFAVNDNISDLFDVIRKNMGHANSGAMSEG